MKSKIYTIMFLFTFSVFLWAGSAGKIRGIVTDENGVPLVGVNVYLENTYIGATTSIDGGYIVLNVSPGKYTLIVDMIGYKPLKIINISVSTDLTTMINAELNQSVLELGEEVVVVAKAPIIQKDLTSSESNISSELLELLPVTNIEDVLNLQAGMIDGHMRGGRSNEISYMIDGIPINDAFSGNASMVIENNIVQEMKVVSGTFNAEYGQAQSGIVDINTKEGSRNLTIKASSIIGDYISSHEDIFNNIDKITPTSLKENTLFLSGPITKKSSYIASIKQIVDEGFLYGKNVFNPSVPTDSISFGNNEFIPMNQDNRTSFYGKLTYKPNHSNKLSFSGLFQNREYDSYDHMFKWNPSGNSTYYEKSGIYIFNWNYMINQKTFLNLKYSYCNKSYKRYVFPDSTDERYSTDDRLRQTPSLSFYTGGTDMSWFTRSTETHILKGDFTKQINLIHQVKIGIEQKFYKLTLNDIILKKNAETNYKIENPPSNTADNQHYVRQPFDFAAFIQSKSEYNNFILNLGVRFDYFDSNGDVISDLSRPKTSSTKKAKPDIQISPRIGMAYPITDRGVMHISYGHFFQVPSFEYLFANPSRTVNPEEGRASVLAYPFGNPELKSQKTVAFEIGLQQQLSEYIGLDVTAYYKDIRNLLGSDLHTIATGEDHSGIQYGRFINLDYGQAKGFTLAFKKRPESGGMIINVDYTYQVVKGNASDPRSALIDNMKEPPEESEKQMIFLNWDQTHTLNSSITLSPVNNLIITYIAKFGSGYPYTPFAREITTAIENSDRKPTFVSFDLFAKYILAHKKYSLEFYLKIFNLFDKLNERNVYNDSGRATYTRDLYRGGEPQGYNSKEEFYNRPDWFSAPRMVQIGIGVSL